MGISIDADSGPPRPLILRWYLSPARHFYLDWLWPYCGPFRHGLLLELSWGVKIQNKTKTDTRLSRLRDRSNRYHEKKNENFKIWHSKVKSDVVKFNFDGVSQEIYFIKKMARKFSSPRNEEEDEQQNEVTPGMFLQRF